MDSGVGHWPVLGQDLRKSAVLVIDIWDTHPCITTAGRIDALARKINVSLSVLRSRGAQVIFAPHGADGPYSQMPNFIDQQRANKPHAQRVRSPLFPYGALACECDLPTGKGCIAGQNPQGMSGNIDIHPEDIITTRNIYRVCRDERFGKLFYSGVYANMCILSRDGGMIHMINAGFDCALIGDLSLSFLRGFCQTRKEEHQVVLKMIQEQVAPVVNMNGPREEGSI